MEWFLYSDKKENIFTEYVKKADDVKRTGRHAALLDACSVRNDCAQGRVSGAFLIGQGLEYSRKSLFQSSIYKI